MEGEHTIVDLTAIAMVAPLNAEFRGSHYHIMQRGTIIIQLHGSDGVIGEAYLGDEDTGLEEILRIINEQVRPMVVGADATSPTRLWHKLYPLTYNIRRPKRTSLLILGAIDAAAWDLVGKTAGLPLWRLWGGARDRLPIIAIGGYYGEPLGPLHEEIAQYKDMGLSGIKFKVGGVSPAEDAARVTQAREAGGDDFVLCVDANQGLGVQAAIELSNRLDGLGVRWFEEPVTWHNDRRALRDVRTRGSLPVCAGQSELSPSGCRDLMETASIDVCNFDASMGGGPTAWLRTAAIAAAYDVEMAHHEEPQVSSHLLASQSHSTYVECFHPDRDPFWWQLIATERTIENGELVMSERPGLGWELDWDYVNRYRVDAA
jgi:L-alanine-DL-glutamate epimerase-like enolase superfamily enzyme